MKRDWIEKAQDVMAILLNHLLFVAAAITVEDLFCIESTKLLLWSAMMVIPLLYYKFTNRPPKAFPPALVIVALGILSAAETIMKEQDRRTYYLVIALLYLMGYFFFYFLRQYLQFLRLNETSASNIPEKVMLRNGLKQTSVFTIGSIFVLLLSIRIDWFSKVAEKIWSWILGILKVIFSGIKTEPPKDEITVEQMQENLSDFGGAVEEAFFPEFFQDIVQIVIGCIVFVAFILGSVMFVLLIYELIKDYLFPLAKKSNKKILQENEDVREYCGVEKNVFPKRNRVSFFDNRRKIRKMYYKKVLRRKSEIIGERDQSQLDYMTAKECCDYISEEKLKQIYEKARYSEADITIEDVKIAKK